MWRRLIETGQFVFNVSDTSGMRLEAWACARHSKCG